MRNHLLLLFGIIILALILRISYAINEPLCGDESISLLQSAGRAWGYEKFKPEKPTQIENFQNLIAYSKDYGPSDVVNSMKYAGMHPPLYYLLLHYAMRFLGNDAFTLRMISVLFSTLSVLVLYLLAKEFLSEGSALFSAFLLAISSYGSDFGLMIRPYPFVMLLGLISTWVIVIMTGTNKPYWKNWLLLVYIITATAGLYSIYHFVFVIAFQMIFLLSANIKNKSNLLTIIVAGVIIAVLYLPWLGGFLHQLRVATRSNYYFHGQANPLNIFQAIITSNFTRSLPGRYAYYKFFIAIFISVITLIGCVHILKRPKGKNLVVGIIFYVLLNFAADVVLKSKTAIIAKLLFLMFPLFLIFLSAGCSFLPKRYTTRSICTVLLVGLFVLHFTTTFDHHKRYGMDGPSSHKKFHHLINSNISDTDKALILLDSARGRYAFSLIHPIRRQADLLLMPASKIESLFENPEALGKYTKVFIVNHAHPRSDFASEDEIEFVKKTFTEKNFTIDFENREAGNTLILLKK